MSWQYPPPPPGWPGHSNQAWSSPQLVYGPSPWVHPGMYQQGPVQYQYSQYQYQQAPPVYQQPPLYYQNAFPQPGAYHYQEQPQVHLHVHPGTMERPPVDQADAGKDDDETASKDGRQKQNEAEGSAIDTGYAETIDSESSHEQRKTPKLTKRNQDTAGGKSGINCRAGKPANIGIVSRGISNEPEKSQEPATAIPDEGPKTRVKGKARDDAGDDAGDAASFEVANGGNTNDLAQNQKQTPKTDYALEKRFGIRPGIPPANGDGGYVKGTKGVHSGIDNHLSQKPELVILGHREKHGIGQVTSDDVAVSEAVDKGPTIGLDQKEKETEKEKPVTKTSDEGGQTCQVPELVTKTPDEGSDKGGITHTADVADVIVDATPLPEGKADGGVDVQTQSQKSGITGGPGNNSGGESEEGREKEEEEKKDEEEEEGKKKKEKKEKKSCARGQEGDAGKIRVRVDGEMKKLNSIPKRQRRALAAMMFFTT